MNSRNLPACLFAGTVAVVAAFLSTPMAHGECVPTPKTCIYPRSSNQWGCVTKSESCPNGSVPDPQNNNCASAKRGCDYREPSSYPPFKQSQPYEKCSRQSGPDEWHKAHPEDLMVSTSELGVPEKNSIFPECWLPLNTVIIRTYCTVTQVGVHARNCPIEKECPAVPFMQINWFIDTRNDKYDTRYVQIHVNNWTNSVRTARFVIFYRLTDKSKSEKLPEAYCMK